MEATRTSDTAMSNIQVLIKDLKEKKIRYIVVEYPSQHIYEIQFEDTTVYRE